MAKCDIFFVTYGGGHVDIVSRVLPHIFSSNNIPVKVFALTTAAQFLSRKGFDYVMCSTYLSISKKYSEAVNLGKNLVQNEWDASSGVLYEESCAYLGVSMRDLIEDLGEGLAWKKYRERGRKAFCPVEFAKTVLEFEQPKVVVITCMVRMERAFFLAAKSLGIKTVLIEDLFGFSLLGEGSVYHNQLIFPDSDWPDFLLVFNDFVKNRFLMAGFPEERVIVTGQPVLSECLEEYNSAQKKGELLEGFRDEDVVTYFAPARRDVLFEQLKAIRRCSEKCKSLKFIVKLHPSVGLDEIPRSFFLNDSTIKFVTDISPVLLLKSSSKVLIFRSTLGLVAILCGTPLFVLDDTGEEVLPYVSSGAATLIDKYENMEEVLQKPALTSSCSMFDNPPFAAINIANFLIEKVN